MTSLVSPEYDFQQFCRSMFGKDPMQLMDAAAAEIAYARQLHREKTKARDFRKGSRGRTYCDNLQQLISLFAGRASGKVSAEFLDAVKPLALDLLQRWEVIGFREILNRPMPSTELGEVADFLVIVISREEVEAGDTSATLRVLGKLLESPKTAQQFAERVDIAFHGYDDVTLELWELPKVRSFVAALDDEFPYWLFFLSKDRPGLSCLLLCLLPPFLTETGRVEVFPARIGELLTRRWFPAMNHVCKYASFSEQEVDALTDRVEAYIDRSSGPRDPISVDESPSQSES